MGMLQAVTRARPLADGGRRAHEDGETLPSLCSALLPGQLNPLRRLGTCSAGTGHLMSVPSRISPPPSATSPRLGEAEPWPTAVVDEPAASTDDPKQEATAPSSDELDTVDDVKVQRCVAALLDDLARQNGQLSVDEVDRATSRRRLSPAETVEVWRGLDAAGVVLADTTRTPDLDTAPLRASRDTEPSTTDPVQAYLYRIGQIPLLTAAQEVVLARRIRAGQAAAAACEAGQGVAPQLRRRVELGRAARHQMITANLRLVVNVAKRYVDRSKPDFLDLVQEGTLGLMRAVDLFDHERGFKFSTYATWWIRQAITRAIADKGRTIRLPVHVHERLMRVVSKRRRLTIELGREPSTRELADDLGEAPETVAFLLDLRREVLSLDQPVGEDADLVFGSLLVAGLHTDPAELAEQTLLSEAVASVLAEFPDREHTVIALRFGLDGGEPQTLEQVGQRFGVTRERIRQIQVKTLDQLTHSKTLRRLQEDYA